MKILVLSNFYPPYNIGGQELSCQQVVDGLTRRGHSTLILTSRHKARLSNTEEQGILRALYLEMDFKPWKHSLDFFFYRKKREKFNLSLLRRVINEFHPDLVFIWGMWNLNRSLAAYAEMECPGKVLYRFADFWPTLPSQHEEYWCTHGRTWFSRLPKQVLGRLALRLLAQDVPPPRLKFEHAYCVSSMTRQSLIEAGIPVEKARVIHTGINVSSFSNTTSSFQKNHQNVTTSILFVGRLTAEKGIETAIKAVQELLLKQGHKDIEFHIVGTGLKEYEAILEQMAHKNGLFDRIIFLGHVPKESMPEVYRQHDILLVPSEWQEPFSRVVLEGMASGLAIIATPCGGTSEVINDKENGLLFTPGDSFDLAEKIEQLIFDRALCYQIAQNGQKWAVEKFSETGMLDEIEAYLLQIANLP